MSVDPPTTPSFVVLVFVDCDLSAACAAGVVVLSALPASHPILWITPALVTLVLNHCVGYRLCLCVDFCSKFRVDFCAGLRLVISAYCFVCFFLLLGVVQSARDYQFPDNLCLDSVVGSFVLTVLSLEVACLLFLLHANLVVSVVCVVFL